MKHHPFLYRTRQNGTWCRCACGWESGTYSTVVGAHLAFGRHLIGSPPTHTDRSATA